MKIALLHPFTPKAAGVVEDSVSLYHSQPHRKSLEMLTDRDGYVCSIQYFTPRLRTYSSILNRVKTEFFPVRWRLNGDHKKWKKQSSKSCYARYESDCPDVTIINMSGHSSPFSHELGTLITGKGKPYIAMLGGRHYSDRPWAREYYKNANHLIVHTNLQRKAMSAMEMFSGLDIRVLPLGVDCQYFSPAESRKNTGSISLLFIGRILELKRIHLAIEVLKKLKSTLVIPVTLRIVGPVVSELYYFSLQQLIKEYSLEHAVEFMGYQDHSRVRDLLREVDLLLLPSTSETFGMVIVESMACGVPVAGIEGADGPEEIIENGVNGVMVPVAQYVDATAEFMLRDEHQKDASRKAARETAVNKFSIEVTYSVLKQSIADCSK